MVTSAQKLTLYLSDLYQSKIFLTLWENCRLGQAKSSVFSKSRKSYINLEN